MGMIGRIVAVLSIVVVAAVVSGCAAPRYALTGEAVVPVEVAQSPHATISEIGLQSDGEHLFVSGLLRHRSSSLVRPHGHVDVSVVSAEGVVIQKVGVQCKGARISRRKSGPCHFSAPVPQPLPSGARLSVEYHPDERVGTEEQP